MVDLRKMMAWSVRAAGRFGGFVFWNGILMSVACDVGVCVGRPILFMCMCHEG